MKDPRPRDDVFAALADELQADTGFCQAMDELEDAVAAAVPPEELAVEITQDYKSVPINEFGATLYKAFTELCEGQGIDVHAAAQTPANYREVSEVISYLTYQMKDTLWAGDTLAASCALAVILDPQDVDRAEVLSIGPDQRVIGRFVSPAIGPLPDETSAILMDSDASSTCGIGILLQDALILDEEGALHAPFGDARVVVPLGTAGLQLEKFMPYYNDNF